MDVVELEDLSGGELLVHAQDLAAAQRRCEVEVFRVALQHAYLHDPASLDPVESARPGREKVRRPGGEDTPEVTEFDAAVAAADPRATAEAERLAAEHQQVARPTRPDQETDHGLRGFYIKAPARTVLVFDAALRRIAEILADLGDTDPVDKRRVKALLVLSRPDLAARLLTAYQAWRDRPDDPAGNPPPEDPDETCDAVVSTSSTDGHGSTDGQGSTEGHDPTDGLGSTGAVVSTSSTDGHGSTDAQVSTDVQPVTVPGGARWLRRSSSDRLETIAPPQPARYRTRSDLDFDRGGDPQT
jgi:hypothetical protein